MWHLWRTGSPVCNDDEHKVWTIKVKDGYTFADGTEINAETVEYSIKMLNDPKLANRNVNATNFVKRRCIPERGV